jgi:hypothetical protein
LASFRPPTDQSRGIAGLPGVPTHASCPQRPRLLSGVLRPFRVIWKYSAFNAQARDAISRRGA